MRSHRAGLRLGANMHPRTCGSESVVCPMGDTVAPSDAQTLSSPTSQPSLGVRARGPLCLPRRDALGAQMTPRLKPHRAPSSFPPAPPGATRSLPASPTVTRRHPVSPGVTHCHPAPPGVTRPPPGPIQPRGSLGEVRRRASARKLPDGRGVAAWDPPLTKAALCPAAAPESCFSPGRPPRLGRCLPARSGPAPITSLRTVGLCAPRGSGYRGWGAGSGRRAMRGPGGRQRLCQDTRERGVFGEPPPPLSSRCSPGSCWSPTSDSAEGRAWAAASMPRLGVACSCSAWRRPAARSDASPRPPGPLRVTCHGPAARLAGLGCLRLRRLKPSARFSPSARVRCFLGLSVQSEAAGEVRHGLPRSARAGSADAELGTGRSSGLGPEAAVTAPRDAGVGPGGGRQPLRGHCPRPPGRSGLTPLPPHARHAPRHRRGRCSFSLPCETSRCRRARRPQAQGSRD